VVWSEPVAGKATVVDPEEATDPMSTPSTSAEATTTAETIFDVVEAHGSMLAMAMLWAIPLVALLLGLISL
jgi:hypothetical protein